MPGLFLAMAGATMVSIILICSVRQLMASSDGPLVAIERSTGMVSLHRYAQSFPTTSVRAVHLDDVTEQGPVGIMPHRGRRVSVVVAHEGSERKFVLAVNPPVTGRGGWVSRDVEKLAARLAAELGCALVKSQPLGQRRSTADEQM